MDFRYSRPLDALKRRPWDVQNASVLDLGSELDRIQPACFSLQDSMADRLFYKIMEDKKEDVIIEENESPDNDASMPCNENYYEMVAVTFDCKKMGHEPKMRRPSIIFKGW